MFNSFQAKMTLSKNLRGIIVMVCAMGVFIAGDSASKVALARVPTFELMAMRAYIGVVLGLILVIVLGQARHLPKLFNPWVIARGLAEVVANFAFTLALIKMPIADLTAIAQTAPLMILVGAALIYGERLGPSRIGLIVVGLTGALLVAQPGASATSPFALLGFLVAIAATCRDLLTRKAPADVPAPVAALAVLSCLLLASLTCTLTLETPVIPSAGDFSLISGAAALMVAGHTGIFLAYTWGEARAVAPFMYALTLWAGLSGLLVFGDVPNVLAVVGMALILLAGLTVIYLDGRRPKSAPSDKTVFTGH